MTLDELKANQEAINKLEEFTDELISRMSDTQKEEIHQELCKQVLGYSVDKVHQINSMFKMGGLLQAKICVGRQTYDISINVQNATKEEFERWENSLLGGVQ